MKDILKELEKPGLDPRKAANVEKATGGKKGGGCPKEAIKKQLDKKIADDLVLRGEKHAGKFGKMKDAIDAVRGNKDIGL